MKYKLISLICCLFVLLVAFCAPSIYGKSVKRAHQHLEAVEKTKCIHTDNTVCSHLPLVKIYTDGVDIPGDRVLNEKGVHTGKYTLAEDGSKTILARMEIIDNKDRYNHFDDNNTLSSYIRIKLRGRSSRSFDKKSYHIRLVNEDGTNNPLQVMGMDPHHEWVLYGPYLDKTLIRNYMWYNIAGEIMGYAPNVRFCEVQINDEYMGLYVMTENITAGADGARLKLSVNRRYNHFTGYLLRLDLNFNENKNINNFTKYTKRNKHTLEIEYPGKQNLTDELKKKITKDFSDFEKALYSYDYNDKKHGYKNYIDVQSFVDYFLINEFTCNYDAGWLSTYIYKDINNKYKLCIWDFNSACDYFRESQTDPMCFQMQNCLWYFMLIKDDDFTEQIIDRYYELRRTYFNEEYLNGYIDDVVLYLGEAIDRNFEKWGYSFEKEYDMLEPEERNPRSFEEAISGLKDFFPKRIKWMDENINVLKQYSAESKVKKFIKNPN